MPGAPLQLIPAVVDSAGFPPHSACGYPEDAVFDAARPRAGSPSAWPAPPDNPEVEWHEMHPREGHTALGVITYTHVLPQKETETRDDTIPRGQQNNGPTNTGSSLGLPIGWDCDQWNAEEPCLDTASELDNLLDDYTFYT